MISYKNVKKLLGNNKRKTILAENEVLKENIKYGQQITFTGSWTHDIKNDTIFLSEEVYSILGTTSQEFDGRLENFHTFVHTDDLEDVKRATEGALSGKEYDIEYRIITPDGKVKFIHEKTKAIINNEKKVTKMVGVIRDITQQKLLENNLRELNNNLNEAQRVSGIGSWKYDIRRNEFFGSDEIYRIYNIDIKDYLNDFENTIKLIHKEDREKLREAMKLHYKGKSVETIFRIPQTDGTDKFVLGKGEPIFNDKGEVIAIQGTLQDITKAKLLEIKLDKSYKLLSQVETLAKVGSWEFDIVNNILLWSDEAYNIFGIIKDEQAKSYEEFLKFVYPDDVKLIEFYMNNPVKGPFDMEFRIKLPDGRIRDIYQRVEFRFDKQKRPIYIYGTIQDITEKKSLQKEIEYLQIELNKQQKRFQILVEKSMDVFEIIDPNGRITYISKACEHVIGYSPDDRLGKNIYDFYSREYQVKLHQLIDQVIQNPEITAQENVMTTTPSGKNVYLEVHMQNYLNEQTIGGIVIHFRDITNKIKIEEKINYINTHDEITSLPNRIHFLDYLKKKTKEHSRFALMMLELGGVNNIVHNLGYETNNKLYILIAKRLRKFLHSNIYISRYSDNNIAIIVQDRMTYGEYEKIAKGIINLLSTSFIVEKYEFNISVHMGICIYPEEAQDVSTIKKHAFSALHISIKDGINSYKFYSSDFDIQNYKEFMIRNDLHKAIDNQQLKINYQPMIDLKTNEILAAEALIRWEHPDWGIIPPSEFIFIAEETGLIIKLGDWLIDEVCKNYKRWLTKGRIPIKISVNFSSVQFFENNFVDKIINTINNYGLDPHFLIAEITESIIMDKIDKTINDIKKMQTYGIQVALDDFGTGYSSLAYLNSFSIDIVKIDKTFIKNVSSDFTSTVIVKGVINMAKELKIKLVAEGIENWGQLTFLRNLNCNTGQGFIYSKPVPGDEFEKLLAKRRCKPIVINNLDLTPIEDRRKFFRINFNQYLECSLTIKEINGKKLEIGNTKVLIKNIGPGGLCFVSNVKFPIKRSIVLKFRTVLLEHEIMASGTTVWSDDFDYDLYIYGIDFIIDENERKELIKFLNQVQIKMKNNILFDEGSFITDHPVNYFKQLVK